MVSVMMSVFIALDSFRLVAFLMQNFHAWKNKAQNQKKYSANRKLEFYSRPSNDYEVGVLAARFKSQF
jgi:hypothetical protein